MKRRLAALVGLLGIACHKAAPSALADAGGAIAIEDAAARSNDDDPGLACHAVRATPLSGSAPGEDLEFGEAVRGSAGVFFVGLLRSSRGEAVASVARMEGQAAATFVDLGVVAGDVPPPQPFLRMADTRSDEVFAAGYVRSASAGASAHSPHTRPLTVFRVGDVVEPLVTLTQLSDEAPSFDVIPGAPGEPVGALLASDEDAPDGRRGLIRVTALSTDMRGVVRTSVASPEMTDAERPELATRATGGYWLAWIARKAEPARDAGPELEGPGEDRAYRWVELVALDREGKLAGPVRRLTTATGHTSGFWMAAHGDRLDLYVGEEDEPNDGAGGVILHVAVDLDGLARVAPLVSSGMARGTTPAVVWLPVERPLEDDVGYLAYADVSDHSRLVPLDHTGAARATARLAQDLDDARLLAGGAAGEILVATARSDSAAGGFHWLSCAPPPLP
jgi:hypothetical protein